MTLGSELPAGAISIGEELWVDRDDGTYRCAHCATVTGTLAEHAKSRLAIHEGKVTDISPLFEDPSIYVDDPVIWRELYCTGCGVRLSTEVARPGDEPVAEFRLEL